MLACDDYDNTGRVIQFAGGLSKFVTYMRVRTGNICPDAFGVVSTSWDIDLVGEYLTDAENAFLDADEESIVVPKDAMKDLITFVAKHVRFPHLSSVLSVLISSAAHSSANARTLAAHDMYLTRMLKKVVEKESSWSSEVSLETLELLKQIIIRLAGIWFPTEFRSGEPQNHPKW